MALVNIINVSVMDNPSSFTNPFQFEVTFECLQELSDGKYLFNIMKYLIVSVLKEHLYHHNEIINIK